LQLLTWSQDTWQRAPQLVRHDGPSWQPVTQSSPQLD